MIQKWNIKVPRGKHTHCYKIKWNPSAVRAVWYNEFDVRYKQEIKLPNEEVTGRKLRVLSSAAKWQLT